MMSIFLVVRISITLTVCSVFCIAERFDVEVISWGLMSKITASSYVRNYAVMEDAFSLVRERYAKIFNITTTFLYDRKNPAMNCEDIVAQIDTLLSEWYYATRLSANFSVLIAPGCFEEFNMNRLAKMWNILMITSAASDPSMRNKELSPTRVVTSPIRLQGFNSLLLDVLKVYNWTSIYLVTDPNTSPGHGIIAQNYQQVLNSYSRNVISLQINTKGLVDYDKILDDFRKNSRVLIFVGQAKHLRNLLISAARSGLTTGYVYITVNLTVFGSDEMIPEYGTDDDLLVKKGTQSLLVLEPILLSSVEPSEATKQQWLQITERRFNKTLIWKEMPAWSFLSALHSTIEVFAQVLNETLSTNPYFDFANGKSFARLFFNRTFIATYDMLIIDEAGQRNIPFVLRAIDFKSGSMKTVMYKDPLTGAILTNGTIAWGGVPDSDPPLNVPICGYLGDAGPCSELLISNRKKVATIATVVIVLAVFCTSGALFFRACVATDDRSWLLTFENIQLQHGAREVSLSRTHIPELKSNFMSKKARPANYMQQNIWIEEFHVQSKPHLMNQITSPSKSFLKLINELRSMSATHSIRFIGVSVNLAEASILLASEYCVRGSLHDIFELRERLDMETRTCFALHFLEGMIFIHTKYSMKFHGYLTGAKCLFDRNFTLKIADLGLDGIKNFLGKPASSKLDTDNYFKKLYWTAPELLREEAARSQSTDVYAVGIILYEILFFRYPYETIIADFGNSVHNEEAVINNLRDKKDPCFRPKPDSALQLPVTALNLLDHCWNENPTARPNIVKIRNQFQIAMNLRRNKKTELIDRILSRLESYAAFLEDEVGYRTAELLVETQKCDLLLLEILPRVIINQLRDGGTVQPESFASVTIMFCEADGLDDFVTGASSAHEVTSFLHRFYTSFDPVLESFDVYKVETVANTYLVASGVPNRNEDKHVTEVAKLSLALRSTFRNLDIAVSVSFKAGMHTGACVAGVVGQRNPRYCLFGDTVNMASRMGTHCLPDRIQASSQTAAALLLLHKPHIRLVERGQIQVKGKGFHTTFWLETESV